MTKSQKILLTCSFICLALAIFSFFFSFSWMTLLFIVLYSVCLFSFCYLNHTAGPALLARREAEQTEEKYQQLRREHEKLKSEFQQLQLIYEEAEQASAGSPAPEEKQSEPEADISAPPAGGEDAAAKSPFADMLPPAGDPESSDPIDIVSVLKSTMEEFTSFAKDAGIQLQISSTLDSLPVRADQQRIRILFRNIIDNSIKYMSRAGSLVITLSAIGDDIFIVLKDNGLGLAETETPHIFEMNYQGSNRISGNGLGLTQAKAIVDYYGGTIYARSKPGSGMGIYIQIPMT